MSSLLFILDITSDRPTKADAAPPNPLNKATNSGISVISTLVAINTPINPPITNPEIINSSPNISSETIFAIVTKTARNIPYAPSLFP